MSIQTTETLTVTIDAPFAQVAHDLADPLNHPEWAQEFFASKAEALTGDTVRAAVPAMGGEVKFRIDADEERGIFDLYLAPLEAPGYGPPLPVRLIPNGGGVDVLWTLARLSGVSDDAWRQGLASMQRELEQLRARHETLG